MKKRTSQPPGRSPEFKGVVKKITGKLTNRPDIEEEGRAEMVGKKGRAQKGRDNAKLNPDPHRRGGGSAH
jgi:uncharacterized protein YjbJ (UPF0337 family)